MGVMGGGEGCRSLFPRSANHHSRRKLREQSFHQTGPSGPVYTAQLGAIWNLLAHSTLDDAVGCELAKT